MSAGGEGGTTTGQSRIERTPLEGRRHPFHVFASRLHTRLDELADLEAWGLDAEECAETLVEVLEAEARLAGLRAKLLARADILDVAAANCATSTAAWLRSQARVAPRPAKRAVALAKALDSGRHPATAQALAAGRVLEDQAHVIVAAVDRLPAAAGVAGRQKAEAHLVGLAGDHDSGELACLGKRLLEVIDPDGADEELEKQLQAEEAEARRKTSFHMSDDGHGRCHGKFTIPSLHGQMLKKLVEGFASPRAVDPIPREEPDGTTRVNPAVLGDAFVRLVEAYPLDSVPASGGLNATVVVTIPFETLVGGLKSASIPGTNVRLSAGEALRLACAAGLVPVVLDGGGRVLHMGRRARFATPAQRLALHLQQHGSCGIEGCDRPASWADAHHWRGRWTDGGTTNLDDLILICPRHHTMAHLPGRSIRQVEGGGYRIHRRT